MRVFLSYARRDGAEFAKRLRDELPMEHVQVWRDVEALEATEEWREQVRAALRVVDAVLVLLTPDQATSDHVEWELESARALQKPILTAWCITCDINESLKDLHHRDLRSPSKYPRELIALLRDLRNVQAKERERIRTQLAAMRENAALSSFHGAIERLQIWLNASVYEPKLIDAAGGLLEQIKRDVGPKRPASQIFREAIDGDYIGPALIAYPLFQQHKTTFVDMLVQLGKEVREAMHVVPVVLTVMTSKEAQELIAGSAFDGYPEELHHDFGELQNVLAANNLADWADRYGATPSEWRPFTGAGSQATIAQVIETVFQRLDTTTPVIPSFIDIRALFDDDVRRGQLWKLRNEGCIVVIDSISMRHPALQRAFQQSILDAYPNISIVNLAPLQSTFELVRRMRIVLRLQASDLEFHKRRDDRSVAYGDFRDIHDPGELEQWLEDRAKVFIPHKGPKGIHAQKFRTDRRG